MQSILNGEGCDLILLFPELGARARVRSSESAWWLTDVAKSRCPPAVAESSLRPGLRTVRVLLHRGSLALIPPGRAPRLPARCPLRAPPVWPSRRHDDGRLRARGRLRPVPGSCRNEVGLGRLRARLCLRCLAGARRPPALGRPKARLGLGPTSIGAIQVPVSVRQHRPVRVGRLPDASAEVVPLALPLHLRRLRQARPCVHLRHGLKAHRN